MQKMVDYYNTKIEALKATIKRLNAEKRVTILRERERTLKAQTKRGITSGQRLPSRQDRRCRNVTLIINVVALILQVISLFLNSHIIAISIEAETRGNLSPIIVTSGPNSMVNIYIAISQSKASSEVREIDVNRPK